MSDYLTASWYINNRYFLFLTVFNKYAYCFIACFIQLIITPMSLPFLGQYLINKSITLNYS